MNGHNEQSKKPLIISPEHWNTQVLNRDITKHLKRGHRWAFANAFDERVRMKSGLSFLRYKEEILGLGLCQADTQLRFRLMCLADEPYFKKNNPQKTLEIWAESQWEKAVLLRRGLDLSWTNSFRLINGEGDGMPGLIVDVYADTAVIKHDHPLLETIWNKTEIAKRIVQAFPMVQTVYLKRRNDDEVKGENILGELAEETIFKENGLLFASNIRDAAKTGFFLDQRDNRRYLQNFSKDRDVLNLFSYTGGFSVFAAAGEARSVTSVDIAKVAIQAVKRNFEINELKTPTTDIATDAFAFVEKEIQSKSRYDLVITDPPSFAPNEKSVPQATAAYTKIFADSLRLVKGEGLFAASSCSSHISTAAFFEITKEAFSKARKRGTLVHVGAQPFDHPFPLAMEELRYLKFALFRVD
jgi:23S rRNA (cytosine1962-C5)-methyltransferase